MSNIYATLKKPLVLISLLVILGGSLVSSGIQAQDISSPEGVALMAIYNATDGANWTVDTNWGSLTEPLANWYGVTVVDGKVTRIRLVTNNLTGTLPDVFASFPDLTFLHLKENNLNGLVPASLGSLTNLTFLGLNDNDFSGDFPAGIGSLTKLLEVYIQKNEFTGTFPDISGLTNLSYLYLNENKFDAVHAGIQSLTKLRELLVFSNKLEFDDIIPLKGLASNRFVYAPQAIVGTAASEALSVGDSFTITPSISAGTGTNSYAWYKDMGVIVGESASSFNIASVVLADAGVYYAAVTNSELPLLTLQTADVTLSVVEGPSVFPDWYITTSGHLNGTNTIVIDEPAITTPAVNKAIIWVENFITGDPNPFQYEVISPALTIDGVSGPYSYNHTTSKPATKTYKYKIQLVDALNNYSALSEMQQSIHLTINAGISSNRNLIWTPYLGKTVEYYEVYASVDLVDLGTESNTGELLATLPSSESTFTDDGSGTGFNYYMVTAVFESVSPAPFGLKNGVRKASNSNVFDISDGFTNSVAPKMMVYPNPVSYNAMIQFDNAANKEYTMYLMDLSGRVIRQYENITGSQMYFERGELKTGIYLLRMVGDKSMNTKMVIE